MKYVYILRTVNGIECFAREAQRRLPRRSPQGEGGPVARALRLGKPGAMKYVYILRTVNGIERYYVGITEDLRARLQKHNSGEVPHTSRFVPWEIKTYIAFSDASQAVAFERYLKSASGRAFAKKRL